MTTGYWTRGHWIEGKDDREGKDIPCKRCGHLPSKKGHDWCLRNLPGVKFACCGHGEQDGYIMFTNGLTIRGPFTVETSIDSKKGGE
jgi:hypothetical protein